MNIGKINQIMEYVEEITQKLGYKLEKDDYYIDDMGCPHKQPSNLPKGYSVIYIFIYGNEFLKIGKANENTVARFTSQHYGYSRANSTLAKSLCNDEYFKALGVNKENVGVWMQENLYRINVLIKSDKAKTELVEAIMHYSFRPKYEGSL